MSLPVARPLGIYTGLSEESLEELSRIGFAYISFGGLDWDDREGLARHRCLLEQWCERIRPYSVHFVSLFNALDFDVRAVGDQLVDWLTKACDLGIQWCTIHARPGALPLWDGNPDPVALRAYEDRLVACLERVVQRTHGCGAGLALENDIWDRRVHNWLCTGEDLVRIASRVDAPNIGICLDMGHLPISGLDPAETIRVIGPWLADTHFNDSFGYFPGRTVWDCDVHIPVGLGVVNWIEVMDALDATGFARPVCFETGGQVYPHDSPRICYEMWRAIELARWRWDRFGNRPGGGTAPRAPHATMPGPGSE